MDCIFCKIVAKQIPSDIVFENGSVIAFRDIHPAAPVHILVIPKKHINGIEDVSEQDNILLGQMQNIIKELARKENIEKSGYRVVINSGPDSGQIVRHLHYHLLGGRKGSNKIF